MTLYPVKYAFLHETQVSHKINPDQWDQTNAYHKSRGFTLSSLNCWVGYNYEVNAYGGVKMARVEGEETCATIGFNRRSVSICLDGDFTGSEMPTEAQKASLAPLIISIMIRHDIPITNVLPHRMSYDLLGIPRAKTCYGSNLSDTWGQELVKNWNAKTPRLGREYKDVFGC